MDQVKEIASLLGTIEVSLDELALAAMRATEQELADNFDTDEQYMLDWVNEARFQVGEWMGYSGVELDGIEDEYPDEEAAVEDVWGVEVDNE